MQFLRQDPDPYFECESGSCNSIFNIRMEFISIGRDAMNALRLWKLRKKISPVWGFWPFCSRLLANFNGLSQDGWRANFTENLRAPPFNKHLLHDTDFNQILHGQILNRAVLKIYFSLYFCGKWWSDSEQNLCICFQKYDTSPIKAHQIIISKNS